MRNRFKFHLFTGLAICFLCITPVAYGKVVYVSLNAAGDGSGT